MQYRPTAVDGAFVVSLEPRGDERGFFARVFCAEEFGRHGLEASISQINTSASAKAGTLRGLHYQIAPHGEVKLVKCIRGAAFDVVVDLREGSPTFGQWAGETLSADNRLMMYVPKGCAHGFLTLEDDTEMLYPATAPYHGPSERILRWNDPRFAVEWPRQPSVLSDKDAGAVDYDPARHRPGY
ncbi:dTDP-4-dehydrorhamnose 3,5-epimerase [Lichenifustis flavocetrariae]|uniref:dTDP-4-dehydrorhamnose 3,5-epimerase n=1 Tax=Lichenifustis flavocetrariae TaxID=2949735 RepID=A0AA42CHW7_9HYPH|nr:dTDP-4-dehydrorhamnose 3,5-epimerase [Lichenifustis flavocetrariae]MCW6507714.1 dTDP-4-dehydrorhamnose 3,5-epimerase [Lichenifustis flavocetrariae]